MYMPSDLIETKVIGCAGTIIINRPDEGNRLTRWMIRAFSEALDDLYHEKRVRAIILTGAGETFCEGIELSELRPMDVSGTDIAASQKQWGDDAAGFRDLIVHMLEMTKPIIASVNGPAFSEGAGLAVASDIVVASQNATLGLPDPRRGLVAGVVAPLLCHRLGAGPSARLLLTSSEVDAFEAHRLGLFHELVETEQVWARAMQLADECAAGAPESIQLTKRLLNETVGEHLQTQLAAGAVMRATSCTTAAAQEGIEAHLEGRSPDWS